MDDLEKAITFNNQEILDLKETVSQLRKQVTTYEEEIRGYQQTIANLEAQTENLERYSRNFNLRFIGLPEATDHQVENCNSKITNLIKQITDLDVDIENAHRTGKPNTGNPRHIIAKFIRRTDRSAVLKARRKLRENGLIVAEDLIHKDLEKRRQLSDVMYNARNGGQRVRFSRGDLYLDGVKYRMEPTKT